MCIHHDSLEWCEKCKKNREACKNAAWKENRWHLSRYQTVIGHKQTKPMQLQFNYE